MKQMFLLFSHSLTEAQTQDAKNNLGVTDFIALPEELQKFWSNIPPALENLSDYLAPLKEYITDNAKEGDVALIQGDFGGSYHMVNFAKSLGLKAVQATTERNFVEKNVNGKVIKTSVFDHILFREYN